MKLYRTPTTNLTGKRALVTGAGRGLGAAAATALAEAGANVTLVARTAAQIEEVRYAINDQLATQPAHAVAMDLNDIAQVKKFVNSQKPFNILVNNAGTNRPAPFIEVAEDDFDHIVRINLRTAFFVAQAVAKKLVETGTGGSIINVSSQMGHVGSPQRSVYCATKHAMEGFTKSMAWELAQHNIRVNTICPTYIRTPLTAPMLENPEFNAQTVSQIALNRVGTPPEIMGAIVFLASEASSLVTGSALKLDGGWTAV